jgi:hypothetical protein
MLKIVTIAAVGTLPVSFDAGKANAHPKMGASGTVNRFTLI